MLHLQFILICLFINGIAGNLKEKYYKELIEQITDKAKHYELPTSNKEFEEGVISEEINDFGSYDFIIIGAGSAGSVLASRLSEVSDWSILLLEAGGEENDFSTIPHTFWHLHFTDMNWGYLSTPQKSCCLGMTDQRCMIPRGKSVGGSSAINAACYTRGNARDYDKWVDLGNPGWSYEEVLPYFIKSEHSQLESIHQENCDSSTAKESNDLCDGDQSKQESHFSKNNLYHGKNGPWNVEYSLFHSNKLENFIKANLELNISLLDSNGQHQIGVSNTQFNTKQGIRQSTGAAFLDNARKRKNLTLLTETLTTKIIVNESNKIAEGIEFVNKNKKFQAFARKEIIISAGAVNTPQLLMLSGLGPKDHLEELGIKVIKNLPVGKNLMDHPAFVGLTFRTNLTEPDIQLESAIKQYLDGLGPLTLSAESVGFLQAGKMPNGVPMLQYVFSSLSSSLPPIADRSRNFNEKLSNYYSNKINPLTDISIMLILLHEKSRGEITLKSTSPLDFPNIDLNFFSEGEEDLDNLIFGIDFVLNLTQTEAFKQIDTTLIDIPVCNSFEKNSKNFWKCAIRQMSMTLFHVCGTSAMGPNEKSSVVDTNLKVHGIKNLRVVDASVFPSTISGPTNAPVVMVAEKISDVIKNEYTRK